MGFFRALAEVYGSALVFEGRATRGHFWAFSVFQVLFLVVWFWATFHRVDQLALEPAAQDVFVAQASLVLGLVWVAAFALPGFSLLVRRLHDAGWSGWWLLLLFFVPVVGHLFLFAICGFAADAKPENRFGRNPRSPKPNWKERSIEPPLEQMGLFTAVRVCFRRAFDFQGRARRKEYWYFFLFQMIVGLALYAGFLAAVFSNTDMSAGLPDIMADPVLIEQWLKQHSDVVLPYAILTSVLSIVFLVPHWAVTVRRFHDTDRSGWVIVMLALICFLSSFAVIALATLAMLLGTIALVAALALLLVSAGALIWFYVILCLPSSLGDNRFGPDPIPSGDRPAPSHPAFAQDLQGAARAEFEAARKAEIRALYRSRVLNKPT